LVVGAIMTPGRRTVAAVPQVMGLSGERQFQIYHLVLHHARRSSREVGRRLLGRLVAALVPADAPVVVGLNETIGRRRKTVPEWGRQTILPLHRWLPDRALVAMAATTQAVFELLADAALYRPAAAARLGPKGDHPSKESASRRWRRACSIQIRSARR
jgi:hypothetical protein